MKNGKKYELARPGDPLVATTGELIEPDEDGEDEASSYALIPPSTPVPFKFYKPTTKRVLSDFRETKSVMNAAAVIFSYTLLGIGDAEICESTGLSIDQVSSVRDSRAYADVFQTVMRELINANSEYIEARIASYSGMALNNVASIAATAKNKGVKLSASKDLLDRAGHRPQDTVSRGNSNMNELHIVITNAKDDDTKLEFNLNKGNENGHSS